MRQVVFDSNAVDPFADVPGAFDTAREAVETGQLDIRFTHVTIDELAEVPDLERRQRLLNLLVAVGRYTDTGIFIVGVSRLDFGRLGEPSGEALASANVRHARDTLIASTSLMDGHALVTHDKRLGGRARKADVEVITTLELLAEFGFKGPMSR